MPYGPFLRMIEIASRHLDISDKYDMQPVKKISQHYYDEVLPAARKALQMHDESA